MVETIKESFCQEFQVEPDLVFPATNNKSEHSMNRNIKTVLSDLFDTNLSNKDFHATAVRKMWDTHIHYIRKNYRDSVFYSQLNQTGHTAATALANYVVPTDRREVLYAYSSSKMKTTTSDSKPPRMLQMQSQRPLPR